MKIKYVKNKDNEQLLQVLCDNYEPIFVYNKTKKIILYLDLEASTVGTKGKTEYLMAKRKAEEIFIKTVLEDIVDVKSLNKDIDNDELVDISKKFLKKVYRTISYPFDDESINNTSKKIYLYIKDHAS